MVSLYSNAKDFLTLGRREFLISSLEVMTPFLSNFQSMFR